MRLWTVQPKYLDARGLVTLRKAAAKLLREFGNLDALFDSGTLAKRTVSALRDRYLFE